MLLSHDKAEPHLYRIAVFKRPHFPFQEMEDLQSQWQMTLLHSGAATAGLDQDGADDMSHYFLSLCRRILFSDTNETFHLEEKSQSVSLYSFIKPVLWKSSSAN